VAVYVVVGGVAFRVALPVDDDGRADELGARLGGLVELEVEVVALV